MKYMWFLLDFVWLSVLFFISGGDFTFQVWTFVQRSLFLSSFATGIFVAASRSSITFLRCLDREEVFRWSDNQKGFGELSACFRHNLSNFYAPVKSHGAELQGPLWHPQRLFPNIVNFAFVLFVPAMYGAIFRFRKNHTTRTQGWCQLRKLKINRSYISGQGISQPERERRTQSNLLTTKINFLAWVIEVTWKWKCSKNLFPPACRGDNSNGFCPQPNLASSCPQHPLSSSNQHCGASLLRVCCREGQVEEAQIGDPALFSAERCTSKSKSCDNVSCDGIRNHPGRCLLKDLTLALTSSPSISGQKAIIFLLHVLPGSFLIASSEPTNDWIQDWYSTANNKWTSEAGNRLQLALAHAAHWTHRLCCDRLPCRGRSSWNWSHEQNVQDH